MTTTTVKTIARAEVSFWWHGFFIREGFYYGELITDDNGELEYTHFVSNGNVHGKRLSVYFHIGTPRQTQKWVFVGEQQHPYGTIGKAYWQKRSSYEVIDHIVSKNTFYSVSTKQGRLFYTDPVDAWCVYDGEISVNGYAVLTEHIGEDNIVLASHGEV